MRAVRFGFLALASAALALGQIGQQPVVVIQQPGMIPQQLDSVNGIKPPNVEPLGDAMARARQRSLDAQLKAQQIEQVRLQNERLKAESASKRDVRQAPAVAWPTAEEAHSYSMSNGRMWKILSANEKWQYLDGVHQALSLEAPTGTLPLYSAYTLTLDEFLSGVDLFYSDPSNVVVPIMYAFRVVSLKTRGGSPSEIESLIASYRRVAAEAPERQSPRK